MDNLLNPELINNLREVINKTDIFIKDKKEKEKFYLICAIMDRFDSSVDFINKNQELPKNENEFINFLVHVTIIKDGIKNVYNVLDLKETSDSKLFEKYYQRDLVNINKKINDDKFFEYFRSLAFAHPFLTNISIPNAIDKTEVQYSPYLLINKCYIDDNIDNVGVEIYSNRREAFFATFPFEVLKEYVKFKYNLLGEIINEFNKIIKNKEQQWKKHKVNRTENSIETLEDVKSILNERYIETNDIDDLITYLDCKCSLAVNNESVKKYRDAIVNKIPEICDAVDNYNHDAIYDIVEEILYARPKAYPMMYYQLEKIYCYLDSNYGEANIKWGLLQAKDFANGFAKKWVKIIPEQMTFSEIKLLTSVACYLECKSQKEKSNESI